MEKSLKSLDRIDRNILRTLQEFGRISNVELAKRVNLSPTPCLERVRRLERHGFIKGYVAQLDQDLLDASLIAFVEVALDRTTTDAFERFADAIRGVHEVMECHMVAGGFDYLLKVRVKNMDAYRSFLGHRLSELPVVKETHTYVVMEEVKATSSLYIAP